MLLSCVASAQGGELVNLSVEIDGWTMMPIAENGATSHIIAARNEDETLTTDIDVVLYEKTADGWSGSAYDPSVTKEDAMIDLADEFGLPDPFGGEWHFDLDPEDVLEHMLPRVGFGKGFFVTDPLYVIAHQVDDPEPLAEGAEDAGLAAGSGAINTGSVSGGGADVGPPQPTDCGCDACIQDSIAAGVDASLADPTLDLDAIETIAHAESQNLLSCCIRWTWTANTWPWGPWYCSGGWALDPDFNSPIWNSGCSVNCHYERDVSRDRTRTRIRRTWGCARCAWVEICTETGQQKARATVDLSNFGCNLPAGFTCPATPDNPPACTDGPDTGVTHTDWAGTPPC